MMVKAVFDAEGFASAFYPEGSIDPELIPETAVNITDVQYREFLNNPGKRRWYNGDLIEIRTVKIHGFTERGSIDVTFDGLRMTVPDDPANHHRVVIAEWEAEGNTIPPYVPPAVDPWEAIRAQRDTLLAETDWYTLRAWEQGIALPPAIADYRQALRDITLQTDPAAIIWPEMPEPPALTEDAEE